MIDSAKRVACDIQHPNEMPLSGIEPNLSVAVTTFMWEVQWNPPSEAHAEVLGMQYERQKRLNNVATPSGGYPVSGAGQGRLSNAVIPSFEMQGDTITRHELVYRVLKAVA